MHLQTATVCQLALLFAAGSAAATPSDDAQAVAKLDIAYQAAVLKGDADAMARIFHADFALVNGKGGASGRKEWLDAARSGEVKYEQKEAIDDSRTVRVAGDTAVVTAKLWIKGAMKAGGAIERVLWYSDTYVRTPSGWKYFFGQASLALPAAPAKADADVASIRAMNDAYIRSWREHDTDWFRTNLADQFVCTAPDGSVLDKAQFIAYPNQGALVRDAHVENVAIRVLGGDTAVVTAVNVVNWKSGKSTATRYTDTYARIDGSWKAVAAQLTADKTFVAPASE
jgi:ketosteroid isomerase-like protein